MKKFTYEIKDELGMHARPAGLLVKEAKKFSSNITLICGEKNASAKGLISVMGLGVKYGNEVTVTAEGEDESEAIAALEAFFNGNF